MLRLVLVHKNTFYAITNKRVMTRSGILGINFKAIDYDKITDIYVGVNPIEYMFKVGTLFFGGGMERRADPLFSCAFVAVAEPYEIFKKVKTIGVDVKTDWNYPNKLRPDDNPGYKTKYDPK